MNRKDEIKQDADEFLRQNPLVWGTFTRFTFEAIHRGFKRYSSKAIFERLRWEMDTADINGTSVFKINNNWQPHFARRFMVEHPEFENFFATRKLTSDA